MTRSRARSKNGRSSSAAVLAEHNRAMRLIDKMALQKCHVQSKLQRKDIEKKAAQRRAVHKRELRALVIHHLEEKALWRNKMKEQVSTTKANFDRELSMVRRQYQLHMEQLRDVYQRQYATFCAEMKNTLDKQIESSTVNYKNLAAAIQNQLTKFQKWMQEELLNQLIIKESEAVESEIEPIRSAVELKMNELIEYLNERDNEIEESKVRLKELEDRLAESRPRTIWAKMRREPQSEPQKFQQENDPRHDDILKIIKEIAQERAQRLQA
ncbi:MAG: hypothetical protein ACREBU_20165 [Nitrososphaera sp.]